MDNYRKIIDNIDEQIMKLLEERLLLVKDVGLYKRQNNIPVLDQKREQLIFDKIDEKYKNKETSKFLKNIYASMMVETKKVQYLNA
jgi:chorismate mutase